MFQILQSEKKKEMTLLCKKKNHGKRDFYWNFIENSSITASWLAVVQN